MTATDHPDSTTPRPLSTPRCRIAILLALAGLASIARPAAAGTYQFLGFCGGNHDWFGVCPDGECAPGVARNANNWDQTACAPATPALPGAGDDVEISALADLSVAAEVRNLHVWSGARLEKHFGRTPLEVSGALVNDGELVVSDGAILRPRGATITNRGAITLAYGGYYGGATLEVPETTTLDGAGGYVGTLVFSNGVLTGSGTLTQGAAHTMTGADGDLQVALVNQGVVDSNANGGTLRLSGAPKSNANLLRASAGGDLSIATAISQAPAGATMAIDAASAIVLDAGAAVTGGTLAGLGGGIVVTAPGTTSSLADLTLQGQTYLENSATLVLLGSGIVNDGTLTVRQGGLGPGHLVCPGPATLGGTGQLVLEGGTFEGGSCVNGPAQTIRGAGATLGVALVNQGLVEVDVHAGLLTLGGNAKSNSGTLLATGGGHLWISTAIAQGATGKILANAAGSSVVLDSGAALSGGTLAGVTGGIVETSLGVAASLADLTFEGAGYFQNGSTVTLAGSGITNQGAILVRNFGAGFGHMAASGDVTLGGSGSVTFESGTFEGPGVLTNGPAHTLRGPGGTFNLSIVNQGTLASDTPGGTLTLAAGVANQGLLRVAAGSGLVVQDATQFTQTNGTLRVDGDLSLGAGALTVAGGAVSGIGTIHGGLTNAGARVEPGDSAGELTLQGNYIQTAAGRLRVELGGLAPGSEHDLLDVHGTATLAGALEVALLDGWQPQTGDQMTVLTADQIVGQFSPPLSAGSCARFTATYSATAVTLTFQDFAGGLFCDAFEGGDTLAWGVEFP